MNGIQEVVGSIPIISTKRKKGTVRCLFSFGAKAFGIAKCRPLRRWLAGAQSRQCCDVRFALCVVFAEFAKGKLVSLPGLCPGNASFPHTRPAKK